MFSASKSGQYQGYQISRSVRLRSGASANFNRTYTGTGTSATIKTVSMWVKRGSLGSEQRLVNSNAGVANTTFLRFDTGDTLTFQFNGSTVIQLITTQVFRDPSAWYHIVFAIDTTQATAANRVKIYVNGSQITAFGTATYPAQNATTTLFGSNSSSNRIGSLYDGTANYFDGYLAEINHIDGQALTPSSFGATNAYGVWSPIKYNGTYGTNGFYLNFSDNSAATAAAIGADSSGNANNFTPNNISVTAGVTYDSMLDVPTLWADGGNGRGNYAVANPINAASGLTISDGNLKLAASASGSKFVNASLALPSSGAFYAEITFANASSNVIGQSIGIQSASRSLTGAWNATGSYTFYGTNAAVLAANGTTTASGLSAISANEVFQVAVDVTNSKMWIGRSNVWYNSTGGTTGDPATGANPTFTGSFADFFFYAGYDTTSAISANFNFGQRPFSYTPPTGFKALNTLNLPQPTISNGANYMAASIYTGTGANLSITNTVNNVSFQPDLVWIKSRSNALDHKLTDSVRGVTKALISDTTGAETTDTTGLTAFNSNGFTVGTGTQYNANASVTYVGWQWKAGAGTTSSNTSGSITSTVSVNTTAGFSVVTYTGTGAAATVGHGLGVAPKMIIVRNRTDGTVNWRVYHTSIGATNYLSLNLTNASAAASSVWNNTAPTSSVFSVANDGGSNGSTNGMVGYCFAEIAGYSKFGIYTGNGSTDGPFIYCGFRPRWIMVKRTDSTGGWNITDTSMASYNLAQPLLQANTSAAEVSQFEADILSNGFKYRGSSTNTLYDHNVSGATYIFAAFAENPFKYSLAR